jgi:hypothetical protein
MDRLIDVLKLMACSADEQKAALPSFVATADEIALLFSDELRLVEAHGVASTLDFDTRRQLRMLGRQLEQMSGKPEHWSNEALEADPEWQRIRESAQALLSRLGKAVEKPILSWLNFVKG